MPLTGLIRQAGTGHAKSASLNAHPHHPIHAVLYLYISVFPPTRARRVTLLSPAAAHAALTHALAKSVKPLGTGPPPPARSRAW